MNTRTVLENPSSATHINIFNIEDHNEAYKIWRQCGLKNKILVHIDAHMDFAWIKDENPYKILESNTLGELNLLLKRNTLWNLGQKRKEDLVDIGNYIHPAIKEGIVKEFWWIVPDPVWQNRKERRIIEKLIKDLVRFDSKPSGISISAGKIETKILGIRLIVTDLAGLPSINEDVLLDIDVDFLLTKSITKLPPYFLTNQEKPWLFPEGLAKILKEKSIMANVATIAYSIEGGFTPLSYKYFGGELKLFLEDTSLITYMPKICYLRRNAHFSWHRKDLDKAIQEYLRILKIDPDDANSHYNLSQVYKEKNLQDEACIHFKRAIDLNPVFHTPYNNLGLKYEKNREFRKAQEEYKRILTIDSNDIKAHLGLSRVLSKLGFLKEAELECEKVLELDKNNPKVHQQLGDIYFKTKELDRSINEYERSIVLGLDEPSSYYNLGWLYGKISNVDKAIAKYKKSAVLGSDGPLLRLRLARLYIKNKNFYKARRQYELFTSLFIKFIPVYSIKILNFILQKK